MTDELTVEEALRAYARMLNTGDLNHVAPLLADNFRYSSQNVLTEITSKGEFLEYMGKKLRTVADADAHVLAEMAHWQGGEPCVLLAQGNPNNLVCTAVVEVANGRISRIDLCAVPPPDAALRTSEYPA